MSTTPIDRLEAMPASGDCELIRSDLWGQPANAISSLAFLVAGIALLRSRPVIGWLTCGVAAGSFLFHGPMPAGAEWAHDTSLAALLLGLMLEGSPLALAGLGTVTGALFGLFPVITDASIIVLAVLAAGVLVRRGDLAAPQTKAAGAILAGSGAVAALARTGGPLCRPGSWLQGHALWHIGAACALYIWASGGARPVRPRSPQPSRASTEKGPSE